MPNVSWSLSRNFAGNIPIDRPGHPNNTLFFWAWENTEGSLTAAANERAGVPWGIWLNGGYARIDSSLSRLGPSHAPRSVIIRPGSSSLLGFMYEVGVCLRLAPPGQPLTDCGTEWPHSLGCRRAAVREPVQLRPCRGLHLDRPTCVSDLDGQDLSSVAEISPLSSGTGWSTTDSTGYGELAAPLAATALLNVIF